MQQIQLINVDRPYENAVHAHLTQCIPNMGTYSGQIQLLP